MSVPMIAAAAGLTRNAMVAWSGSRTWLATNGFVTGVTLPVDGGLSIASPAAWLRPDLQER